MPEPRVAHCVFCDDIRQEIGNKLSLMGVYAADLFIVGKPPIVLPRFGIVVWIIADIDDAIERVTTTVLMPPDGAQIVRIETSGGTARTPQLLEGARKLIARQIIPIAPFVVRHAGIMQVMVETERGELRAGRLMIHFADAPQDATGTPAA